MNTRQDCCDIIRWTPSILQDVEAQLAGGVNVGVEHLADELDSRRLVRILLLEMHHESKGAVLEWGIGRADDDSVP